MTKMCIAIADLGADFMTINCYVLICLCYCSKHKMEMFTSTYFGNTLTSRASNNRFPFAIDVADGEYRSDLALGHQQRYSFSHGR